MAATAHSDLSNAETEVVDLASELIRIDTTNTGNPATVVGERAAAEYVAAKLAEVGYEPSLVESGAANRCNVLARLPGAGRGRGGRCCYTVTSTSCRPTWANGQCIRSPTPSWTVTCGDAARWT